MPTAQEPLFALEDIPKPAPFVPDWGVLVNECKVFVTSTAAEWWALFSCHRAAPGRITRLMESIAGGWCHVACDSKEDAELFAEGLITYAGMPKSAVTVKRLVDCRRRFSDGTV